MVPGRENILLILSETILHLEFGPRTSPFIRGSASQSERAPFEETQSYFQSFLSLRKLSGVSWAAALSDPQPKSGFLENANTYVYGKIIHPIKLTAYIETPSAG